MKSEHISHDLFFRYISLFAFYSPRRVTKVLIWFNKGRFLLRCSFFKELLKKTICLTELCTLHMSFKSKHGKTKQIDQPGRVCILCQWMTAKHFVKTSNDLVKKNKSQFFNNLVHLCLSQLEVWGQVLGYLTMHGHSFQLYSIFTPFLHFTRSLNSERENPLLTGVNHEQNQAPMGESLPVW